MRLSYGKREKVICGRIPGSLFDAIHAIIGTGRFRTVNDFVEEAVFEKWRTVANDKGEVEPKCENKQG